MLTRFIDINIRNLAGVPSVVYGLLGLAIFVAAFATLGIGNGRNILTGGLTLAVLILPLVIITSAEAIRSVPTSLREGGFGLGASRWQVVRGLVMPSAVPGILTGTVLALSRALGETAPLIVAGAVLGSFSTGGSISDLLTGSVHGPPGHRLRLGAQAPGRVPCPDLRRHHRPARGDPHREHAGDLPAQPVRQAMVMEPGPRPEPMSADDTTRPVTEDGPMEEP